MSTEHESMMGILKLYELRSEATMRKARDWFALSFHPESAQDILQVLVGEHSADFRMVASYWDMAAASSSVVAARRMSDPTVTAL
jgi:hypothetical protein